MESTTLLAESKEDQPSSPQERSAIAHSLVLQFLLQW
jgi:hypothetical protein